MYKNKEEEKAYKKAYNEKNKERHKEYCRVWYQKNKERLNTKNREWFALPENKAKIKAYRQKSDLKRKGCPVRSIYNAAKIKNQNLKKTYGITLDQFNKMSEEQNHQCYICKKIKKLCMDHCHKTGKIRKLL